jgi:hypothetical protein
MFTTLGVDDYFAKWLVESGRVDTGLFRKLWEEYLEEGDTAANVAVVQSDVHLVEARVDTSQVPGCAPGEKGGRGDDPESKRNLRAVIAEYCTLDDCIPEDKILELLIGAVTKPTIEQPLVVQCRVKGTRANKLYHTPENKFTDEDQRFFEGVDDFRKCP